MSRLYFPLQSSVEFFRDPSQATAGESIMIAVGTETTPGSPAERMQPGAGRRDNSHAPAI
jgi:hypothetical protein